MIVRFAFIFMVSILKNIVWITVIEKDLTTYFTLGLIPIQGEMRVLHRVLLYQGPYFADTRHKNQPDFFWQVNGS